MENIYNPNIAIHPGRTLQDTLDSLKMRQVDLAQRTGLTPKTINKIMQGKNPITIDTAIKLSSVFGMSATFWNNLQRNYEETLARIKSEEKLEKEITYFKKFTCYNELVKWGYVKKARNRKEKIINFLNFFGVSSLGLIPEIYVIAFRTSKVGKISNESLAAWLRCGELDAQKIRTQKFDRDRLIESINALKLLTKEEPKIFQKKLIEICSSFGIAVVFVPYLKNTYVYGMTRWLNSDKAMIQLSLRGSYDDIFWFTFFHELAHLLKHSKKEQFVEFENKDNRELKEKEDEADEFASNTLIPKSEYLKFISQNDFSKSAIINFADKLDISPSIVAGRLSYDNNNWTKWSRLRKRLKFVNED